jgi:hypothetical protein
MKNQVLEDHIDQIKQIVLDKEAHIHTLNMEVNFKNISVKMITR